jgi:hypothetical protein
MGTEERRKVQVFSSEIVEEDRTLLTQKRQNLCRNPVRGVAEKRLFTDHADSFAG